jgi:hypothetical protein
MITDYTTPELSRALTYNAIVDSMPEGWRSSSARIRTWVYGDKGNFDLLFLCLGLEVPGLEPECDWQVYRFKP